jgi:hypothetical protein
VAEHEAIAQETSADGYDPLPWRDTPWYPYIHDDSTGTTDDATLTTDNDDWSSK